MFRLAPASLAVLAIFNVASSLAWPPLPPPATEEAIPPFYAIAHMCNQIEAVDWAMNEGANAVEIDLNFESWKFVHGVPCDCTCAFLSTNKHSVCSIDEACKGGTDAAEMMRHLGGETWRDQLALVYVDSKVDTIEGDLEQAGQRVGDLLLTELFGLGYGGVVIVNSPKMSGVQYLQGVVDRIQPSKFEGRVFYTIDQEKDVVQVLEKLITVSPFRAYSTGISACAPVWYTDQITLAQFNYAEGVLSLPPGIWTIDKESSMRTYMNRGARAVMTNIPKNAVLVGNQMGLVLAKPSHRPRRATSDEVVTSFVDCDCDFHPGGCSISKAAPNGAACKCSYKGGFTCGGDVVSCLGPESSALCVAPDTSFASCKIGDGDCDGYQCDCDYHPGGCSISKAAPNGAACKCEYKGGFTCGGDVVSCLGPESSALCVAPDMGPASCIIGGGDCGGYSGNDDCDCDYHAGGCSISKAAPEHTACKCSYKGGFTCGGDIVHCSESSALCVAPDTSLASCKIGGGDCDGYQCDCDYHAGGCTISMAAPNGAACKCSYKGWFTCGGDVVHCSESSALCVAPDMSKDSCKIGGGDCDGY